MATRLFPSKLHLIRDMIESQSLSTTQMAEEAECKKVTIINIRRNLRQVGSVHALPTRIDRRALRPPVGKTGPVLKYLDEMAIFLWHEFYTMITTSSIRRALVAKGWSKKTARQHTKERNADLRELYRHYLSDFQSYHLVYVDESECDRRAGLRRTGWLPFGVAQYCLHGFLHSTQCKHSRVLSHGLPLSDYQLFHELACHV